MEPDRMALELSEIEASVGTQAPPAPLPVKKFNYSHDAMIDLILAYPHLSQDQIAQKIGYTSAWVSTVMSSDAFQARLADRREQILDPILTLKVQERFEGMMQRSMEVINHHLSKPVDTVPVAVAMKAFELSSRAKGYGARTDLIPPTNPVEVHLHLENLGQNLIDLNRRVLNAPTKDVSNGQ